MVLSMVNPKINMRRMLVICLTESFKIYEFSNDSSICLLKILIIQTDTWLKANYPPHPINYHNDSEVFFAYVRKY